MWRTLLNGYQYVLLVYFSSLNILYALFSCIGLRAIVVVFAREFSQGSLRDLLERDVYKPVSILVPAHNEEVSIVGSVQSLLNLQFPEFEIVVVSDGSEDEHHGAADRGLRAGRAALGDPPGPAERATCAGPSGR